MIEMTGFSKILSIDEDFDTTTYHPLVSKFKSPSISLKISLISLPTRKFFIFEYCNLTITAKYVKMWLNDTCKM